MTCIVGVVDKGRVWIGADSCGSNGWNRAPYLARKVFKRGEFLIGYTTSFRMGQLIEHCLEVRPRQEKESSDAFMTIAFAGALRECLKEHGALKVESGVESCGTMLVGYRGELFLVEDHFHALRSANGYAAVGIGYMVALGALAATTHWRPRSRVMNALRISGEHCEGVGPPFHVMSR